MESSIAHVRYAHIRRSPPTKAPRTLTMRRTLFARPLDEPLRGAQRFRVRSSDESSEPGAIVAGILTAGQPYIPLHLKYVNAPENIAAWPCKCDAIRFWTNESPIRKFSGRFRVRRENEAARRRTLRFPACFHTTRFLFFLCALC